MEIRKTKLEELDEVMEIYENARNFMTEHKNPTQWKDNWPPKDLIEEDILAGKHYVCMQQEQIAAVFYFAKETDPTYGNIYDGAWLNEEPYAVVHRIASSGITKGAGSFVINWAGRQCKNLRIDTHEDNYVMQNMLKKCGCIRCGTIYLGNGEPRIAFQKVSEHD